MKQTPTAGELQRRFVGSTSRPAVDTKARTCELSFSSTTPVEREFGIEVLSHAAGAADLSRLNNSAPLLFNHDLDDILGVVESATIAGGKGRAFVRFGQDERGEWAMRQAADGVLVNVSFSYRVTEYDEAPNGDLIALHWEVLEISLVTVPADNSVGIGRSINFKRKTTTMDELQEERGTRSQRAQQTQQELRQRAENAGSEERLRIRSITMMGSKYSMSEAMVNSLIDDGSSVDQARQQALEIVTRRGQSARSAADFGASDSAEIGMTSSEIGEYSICRAIVAMISNDWRNAGLEQDASRSIAQRMGKQTTGLYVPLEVMRRSPWDQRAIYQVGTPVQGGNLVATNLNVDFFTEALRNQSQVLGAGATMLTGLVGNVDIPRRTGVTNTFWVAESGAITEAEATFDKIQLRPKTIGALSKMSRLMLMQSTPAIEQLTRSDLMQQLALGIDLAALSGTGASNQPLGISGTSGIGTVTGGTNGLAVSLDHIIQLETQLANSNAPVDSRAYLLNTKTIASLKGLKASTGAYLWSATGAPGQLTGTPAQINGYPALPTNQARSTLNKGTSTGVCSELFFGAWSELVIGQWGVLEIVANPYDASGFPAGDVLIRAMQTLDIQVRHAASFAVMSDALTP